MAKRRRPSEQQPHVVSTLGQLKRGLSRMIQAAEKGDKMPELELVGAMPVVGAVRRNAEYECTRGRIQEAGAFRRVVEWAITILGAECKLCDFFQKLEQSHKMLAYCVSQRIYGPTRKRKGKIEPETYPNFRKRFYGTYTIKGEEYAFIAASFLEAFLGLSEVKGGYNKLKSLLAPPPQDAAAQAGENGGQSAAEQPSGNESEAQNGEPSDLGSGSTNAAEANDASESSETTDSNSGGDSLETEAQSEKAEPTAKASEGKTEQGIQESQSKGSDAFSTPKALSKEVFWPQKDVPLPDAAARQAGNILIKKVRELAGNGRIEAPLVSGKKVVKELISKRYSLPRMKGRAITSKRKSLIMVDISGSCSAHSPQTNAAAKALYQACPDLVVVMHHCNGDYVSHIGEMPDVCFDATMFGPIVAYWEAQWGLIVSFGDNDSWFHEIEALKNGATIIKLDSYCKKVTGFQFDPKGSQLAMKEANHQGRYLRFIGCDDAPDLVKALKTLG